MKKETLSTLFGVEEIVIEETPKQQIDVWKFINSISENKQYFYDENTENQYIPWTVNRSFSAHLDTVTHAVFLNSNHHLDKKMQYDYLFYAVPKKKRWKPWLKKSEAEKKEAKILEDVAKVINYNLRHTMQFWKTLTPKERKDFLERFVYPNSKNSKK